MMKKAVGVCTPSITPLILAAEEGELRKTFIPNHCVHVCISTALQDRILLSSLENVTSSFISLMFVWSK